MRHRIIRTLRNISMLPLAFVIGSCATPSDARPGAFWAGNVERAELAIPRDPAHEAAIDSLLATMSLEEKVGQMRVFHARLGIDLDANGELVLSDDVKERLATGIGGIKNPGEYLPTREATRLTNALQRYIIENSPSGIPALFITEAYNGVDAEGTTRFARPINMASTWSPDLVKTVWDTIGREARLRGLHMAHSPEADVMRDPRFGRMSEAYSEDTHLTSEMVVAAVTGMQGNLQGVVDGTHIGATTKHFAGYGQVQGGLNFAATDVTPRVFADDILPPFEAAVKRGQSLAIMPSHGDIDGVASHGNPDLLTKLLRHDWGFDGYVISDSNDIARLNTFMKVAESEDLAAIQGLKAGNDIDLYSEIAYSRLIRLAREDPELMPYIDQAVRRVLRTKMRLGLFDDPYIDVEEAGRSVRTATSLDLAYRADLESVVLLKNQNNTLPLDVAGKRVALIGPLLGETTEADFAAVLGDGVSFVSERALVLTDEHKNIPNARPADDPENEAGLLQALTAARSADVVILFLGGDEHTAKEAYFNCCYGDRFDLDPVGRQNELIERVSELGKPVIVVLKHRRTLSIPTIAEKADAILDAWDLSERGDEALAALIVGNETPSGHLSVTVPRHIGQFPFHYSRKHINFKKDYLFGEPGPQYPFGHGLSYTEFELGDIALADSELARDGTLSATIDVTNTGLRAGQAVLQLYITDEIGSVLRPAKELKAFRKIALARGDTQSVTLDVPIESLAFSGLDMVKRVEAGDFTVEIGLSSEGGRTATFAVK